MTELKKLFMDLNFGDVRTYIQSGNVIFSDAEKDAAKLKKKIENALFDKLGGKITIALLTDSEIKKVINNKPEKFGEEKEKFRYDVIFLIVCAGYIPRPLGRYKRYVPCTNFLTKNNIPRPLGRGC